MRIVLVDDQPLVRNGIASLLRARGYEVVGEAGDGQEALGVIRRARPDLVLMDLQMPVLDGLGAMRRLRSEMPALRVVILTVSDDEQDLFEAVKSGALGYLLKDLEAEAFFEAIEAVGRGESVIPPRLARGLWTEFDRGQAADLSAEAERLTEREREVLALVAAGQTNREVAERLTVSENTVKFHMRGILDKLHLRNRTEVARWASEQRSEGGRSRPTGLDSDPDR
ncbi:MAG: response regulator transcription factor [Dehalococcoidia bacterium]|nr:response regulator transcription factor [Dehalococcoidia bacterium]MCA9850845.1 response regulator transcription factor [Dehalococcoidia bacterium]